MTRQGNSTRLGRTPSGLEVAEIKVLGGLLPICSHCKKIRDDRGYWRQLEIFLREHSEARLSHGICPECMARFYPGLPSSEGRPEGGD